MSTVMQPEQLKDAWLVRLTELIDRVKHWAKDLDLPTREITVNLKDSEIGQYKAPGLLIQDEAVKMLLEPIARSAPGPRGSSISISCQLMMTSRACT